MKSPRIGILKIRIFAPKTKVILNYSGKGCTSEGSQGSSDSERSSPDRDPKSLRFRKTNLHSRITNEVLDLSKIDQDPEEQTSRRTSSVTFCNEPDLVLHLDTTNNPHR